MATAGVKRQLKLILASPILGVSLRKNGDVDRSTLVGVLARDEAVVSSLHDLYGAVAESCPNGLNVYKTDPALGDLWYIVHNWKRADSSKRAAVTAFLQVIFASKAWKLVQSSGRINEMKIRERFGMNSDVKPFHEHKPQRGGESYIGQPTPSDTSTRHVTQKSGDALIPSNLSYDQGKGDLESTAHPDAFMTNQSLPIVVDIQDAMSDIASAQPSSEMKYNTLINPHSTAKDQKLMKHMPTHKTAGLHSGNYMATIEQKKVSREAAMITAANSQFNTGRGLVTIEGQRQLNTTSYQTTGQGTGGRTTMGATPGTETRPESGSSLPTTIPSKPVPNPNVNEKSTQPSSNPYGQAFTAGLYSTQGESKPFEPEDEDTQMSGATFLESGSKQIAVGVAWLAEVVGGLELVRTVFGDEALVAALQDVREGLSSMPKAKNIIDAAINVAQTGGRITTDLLGGLMTQAGVAKDKVAAALSGVKDPKARALIQEQASIKPGRQPFKLQSKLGDRVLGYLSSGGPLGAGPMADQQPQTGTAFGNFNRNGRTPAKEVSFIEDGMPKKRKMGELTNQQITEKIYRRLYAWAYLQGKGAQGTTETYKKAMQQLRYRIMDTGGLKSILEEMVGHNWKDVTDEQIEKMYALDSDDRDMKGLHGVQFFTKQHFEELNENYARSLAFEDMQADAERTEREEKSKKAKTQAPTEEDIEEDDPDNPPPLVAATPVQTATPSTEPQPTVTKPDETLPNPPNPPVIPPTPQVAGGGGGGPPSSGSSTVSTGASASSSTSLPPGNQQVVGGGGPPSDPPGGGGAQTMEVDQTKGNRGPRELIKRTKKAKVYMNEAWHARKKQIAANEAELRFQRELLNAKKKSQREALQKQLEKARRDKEAAQKEFDAKNNLVHQYQQFAQQEAQKHAEYRAKIEGDIAKVRKEAQDKESRDAKAYRELQDRLEAELEEGKIIGQEKQKQLKKFRNDMSRSSGEAQRQITELKRQVAQTSALWQEEKARSANVLADGTEASKELLKRVTTAINEADKAIATFGTEANQRIAALSHGFRDQKTAAEGAAPSATPAEALGTGSQAEQAAASGGQAPAAPAAPPTGNTSTTTGSTSNLTTPVPYDKSTYNPASGALTSGTFQTGQNAAGEVTDSNGVYVPTLRLFFREGDANIVSRINDNPKALSMNQKAWADFSNYDWEANMEVDNDLQMGNIQQEGLRFSGQLEKDSILEQQAAEAIQENYNKTQTVYSLPQKCITDGDSLILDVRGGGNLNPMNEDETEAVFHNVYIDPWIEIPESSPLKRFTAVMGTQLPDSMRQDPECYTSGDSSNLRFQDAYIYSTII